MKQQFGLIKPTANKKPQETKKVASLFEAEDSEEELQALRTQKQVSTSCVDDFAEDVKAKALQEDPNVYDYDGALEAEEEALSRQNLHRNSRLPAAMKGTATASTEKGPQYMANLLARAEERKIQSELIRLRNAKKKANSDATDGEEVFVTSAYKERLQELEAKESNLQALQAGLEDGDVSKRQDMSGFYFNLMKRNVSFGGSQPDKRSKVEAKLDSNVPVKQPETIVENKQESTSSEEVEEEEISFGPVRPVKK